MEKLRNEHTSSHLSGRFGSAFVSEHAIMEFIHESNKSMKVELAPRSPYSAFIVTTGEVHVTKSSADVQFETDK